MPMPVVGMPVEPIGVLPSINAEEVADKLRRFTRPALAAAPGVKVEVVAMSGSAAVAIARTPNG